MNGALRRSKTSRELFIRALLDVIAERDGLKMRETASWGNYGAAENWTLPPVTLEALLPEG
ncbi:hypothetical protein LAV84_27270 [Rhizobium sp. VS19-DR104.2]|nr:MULTISPECIES: hypothetical protein [unclassified Rhizobium]MBZ5763283.1 hypothetical protein [Rhizobium sp. VS19-DR96]MBZ5769680.1 hypothetical protein [Rhizobium sp. VS19-DR129.2]MBZ5777217.1 hypothetical protein [Rhizobium sp. VS19-DRK62.2]MBZ5787846.1 hypothetical protein [Rhizobium sp. VS19-DR121]MBZ5805341.1 hypothetical protein [Rhizobium sp. VS19-DR181]